MNIGDLEYTLEHLAEWMDKNLGADDQDREGFLMYCLARLAEDSDYFVTHNISWADMLSIYLRQHAAGVC